MLACLGHEYLQQGLRKPEHPAVTDRSALRLMRIRDLVNSNGSSLYRDVIGIFGGGIVAAVTAVLAFLAFIPLPEPKPTDHTREALGMVIVAAFFSGGFIGRRAFSADCWSDMLPSVAGSYAVIGFLCLISGLDISESASMVGFISVGIVSSAAVSLLAGRRFPPRSES